MCDEKIPIMLQEEVYHMVIRQSLCYGLECWPAEEIQQRMMVGGCMCNHMWFDKPRNRAIRNKVEVTSIKDKIREATLRWFEHVRRMDITYLCKACED